MKVQILTAAILAVLASRATFAASEGGDTWSELQPQLDARSSPPLTVPAPGPVGSVQGKYLGASGRSEGGDTWSEVEPKAFARSSPAPVYATLAPLSIPQREEPTVYGTPAEGDSADIIVRLGADSRWINVAYGETVKFIVNDDNGSERSFTWHFDVSAARSYVDLSDVAPADLHVQNVRVFVAPDPLYRGG